MLTHIKRVANNPNAAELLPAYDFLCDATHPNVIGNARFWGMPTNTGRDCIEVISIEREAEFITVAENREKVVWSRGWSAACVKDGFHIGQLAVLQLLLQRWPNP